MSITVNIGRNERMLDHPAFPLPSPFPSPSPPQCPPPSQKNGRGRVAGPKKT